MFSEEYIMIAVLVRRSRRRSVHTGNANILMLYSVVFLNLLYDLNSYKLYATHVVVDLTEESFLHTFDCLSWFDVLEIKA